MPPPKTSEALVQRAGEGYNTVAWYDSTKSLSWMKASAPVDVDAVLAR